MSNGKVMIIHLISGLIQKTVYKMSQYFLKPYESFRGDINVKVDLSNYAKKKLIRKMQQELILNSNLPNLKAQIDKIDLVDKLKTVPIDLNKLNNVVNNNVVKKLCMIN